jgi:hypothetical protein
MDGGDWEDGRPPVRWWEAILLGWLVGTAAYSVIILTIDVGTMLYFNTAQHRNGREVDQ